MHLEDPLFLSRLVLLIHVSYAHIFLTVGSRKEKREEDHRSSSTQLHHQLPKEVEEKV